MGLKGFLSCPTLLRWLFGFRHGFGFRAEARCHQRMQAAVVGAGNVKQQIAQLHFFTAHGQMPQLVDD